MIETRYTLPALIAASAHLALLFAYPSAHLLPSHPPAAAKEKVELHEVPLPPLETPPPEANPEPAPVTPLQGNPAAPEIPEPPTVQPRSDFEVVIAPGHPIGPVKLDRPPLGPYADGDNPIGGPPSGPKVFTLGQLDQPPRARTQHPPVYPHHLRSSGIEGSATVLFTVNDKGQVVDARVVEATQAEFGEAAVRAILRWQFEAGRLHGRPVSFRMTLPVVFSLAAD